MILTTVLMIATAAAVDSAGDIWIAGSTPLALGLVAPTPSILPFIIVFLKCFIYSKNFGFFSAAH